LTKLKGEYEHLEKANFLKTKALSEEITQLKLKVKELMNKIEENVTAKI
jgi:hypothetical protein